jgi:hypothetical protein
MEECRPGRPASRPGGRTPDTVRALDRYHEGMKGNSRSSITLRAGELRLVKDLKARLKLKSNVEVVRAGLRLLKERQDREVLRQAYRKASRAGRASLRLLADL